MQTFAYSFLDSSKFCSLPTLPNRGRLLRLRGSLDTLSLGGDDQGGVYAR